MAIFNSYVKLPEGKHGWFPVFSILQSIELIQPIQWGSLFDEDISKHEEFTSCNDGETTRGDGTVLALLAVARRPTNLGLGRFLQQPSSFVSGKETIS